MYKLNFCEYNRSNQDYDTIFRPSGSGDFLFLMLKSPMKVYLEERLVITRENACILYTPSIPLACLSTIRPCAGFTTAIFTFLPIKIRLSVSISLKTLFFIRTTQTR